MATSWENHHHHHPLPPHKKKKPFFNICLFPSPALQDPRSPLTSDDVWSSSVRRERVRERETGGDLVVLYMSSTPTTEVTQQDYTAHSGHGSVGPVIAVLAVITILGVIAGIIGRLCSGRTIMGRGQYDFEGWVERKFSSCIDGRVGPPPRPPPPPQPEEGPAQAAVEIKEEEQQQQPQPQPRE